MVISEILGNIKNKKDYTQKTKFLRRQEGKRELKI